MLQKTNLFPFADSGVETVGPSTSSLGGEGAAADSKKTEEEEEEEEASLDLAMQRLERATLADSTTTGLGNGSLGGQRKGAQGRTIGFSLFSKFSY